MGKNIRLFTVLVAMVVWISGCGSGSNDTVTVKTDEGRAEVSKDGDKVTVKTDEGKTTITSNEDDGTVQYEASDGNGGTVKVESGSKELPKDFPKEIPLPEDAEIVTTVNMSSDQMKGYMVSLSTGLDVQKGADFYRDALKKDGYELADTSTPDGVTLVGENDTYNMFIVVVPDTANAGKTSITITFGAK
ncbi:hypothetical protein [Cohnella yongneupensis]|uniref:Lipoprotein n=1 Tax=Cohnella yongneupensis TaxID=425006 RepID=A0ABW0QX07_9BACL